MLGLFATGLVGLTLIDFLAPGGGDLYASLVAGLGCGLLLALLGWRDMRHGADVVTRPLRPLSVFNLIATGVGVALLAWGTIALDWPLALSGLPLLALGVGLMTARHLPTRRRSTD